MLKSKIGSVQEVILPDFPDDDNTVTTTVTKSRRVSFGTNFVKEFIVGSAVSAQCMSEYEQASPSSDSSNANSSQSVVENEVLDRSTFVMHDGLKVHKSFGQPSESDSVDNRPKPPKFSSTICFSADSPTADMEFTEGCLTLAKSILDKKNKEMTVIIQAKPKEPKEAKDEEKPKAEETKYFADDDDDSQYEMSMTRCLKPVEVNVREGKRFESERTKIFSKYEQEMSITQCNKIFVDNENESRWEESKENRMPLDMIIRHLDKDSSDLDNDLFSSEKSFNSLLSASPFDFSKESEDLNFNESADMSIDLQPNLDPQCQKNISSVLKEKGANFVGSIPVDLAVGLAADGPVTNFNDGNDELVPMDVDENLTPKATTSASANVVEDFTNKQTNTVLKDVNHDSVPVDMDESLAPKLADSVIMDIPESPAAEGGDTESKDLVNDSVPMDVEDGLTLKVAGSVSAIMDEDSIGKSANSVQKDVDDDAIPVTMNEGLSSKVTDPVLENLDEDSIIKDANSVVRDLNDDSVPMHIDEVPTQKDEGMVPPNTDVYPVTEDTDSAPKQVGINQAQAPSKNVSPSVTQYEIVTCNEEPSLIDMKVIENLKEQSKEQDCIWSLEEFVHPKNNSEGFLSVKCKLLESSTNIQFNLRMSKEDGLYSCSGVTRSEINLNEEKEWRLPEYKCVVEFGFQQLKKYYEELSQKVETIRHIPYFLDQINQFMLKMNSLLQQIYSILTSYPGSTLKGSLLSFRLFSFPLFFSCLISVDLTNLFRLSKSSLLFVNHFGSFNENTIREIFQECLKCENSLCEFILRSTMYLIDLEKETGYVSKRGHIRLLPAELKL